MEPVPSVLCLLISFTEHVKGSLRIFFGWRPKKIIIRPQLNGRVWETGSFFRGRRRNKRKGTRKLEITKKKKEPSLIPRSDASQVKKKKKETPSELYIPGVRTYCTYTLFLWEKESVDAGSRTSFLEKMILVSWESLIRKGWVNDNHRNRPQ